LSSRFLLWDRAVGMMKEFPMTGAGIGTYYRVSPQYHDKEVKKWSSREGWQQNTHNYYLQLGAELGIPALLIFLVILFYAYRTGVMVYRQKQESCYIIRGLLFGLTAYLITMVTSHPLLLSNQQFLFWFLIWVLSMPKNFQRDFH
jgi:O-antigen ligase